MTLLELHRDAEIYDMGKGKRKLVTGGDIYNPLPFDGGPRARGTFVFADGIKQGNWTWLGKGEQGYAVKPNTGTVRVFPVKGHGPLDPLPKYIQISGMAPQTSEVNQIDDRNLELFINQAFTRWSLKMGPQGFKPEIVLKPGWTGTPEWQFRFELNGGLTLDGAWIMDGGIRVLKMHNPFVIDSEGTTRAVNETLVDGVVTLTADLSGLTYPITVDPTLGPLTPSKDASLLEGLPTFGFGQANTIQMGPQDAGRNKRFVIQFDISAIPVGATVTTATLALYLVNLQAGLNNATFSIFRCTRTNWDDNGSFTNNAECNWNDYLESGPTAWTTPGGDFDGGTSDGPFTLLTADIGSYINNDISTLSQDAIDNRVGLLSALSKLDVEDLDGTDRFVIFNSLENAANKPELTVVYEVGGAFNRSRIVNMGAVGPQNRSTIANA